MASKKQRDKEARHLAVEAADVRGFPRSRVVSSQEIDGDIVVTLHVTYRVPNRMLP